MKADKIYRIGVLGLGEGRSIISAALKSDRYELVNVCDLNEELCKERVKEFGLPRYTLDYNEMLRDDTIEVIGIYTPDQLHGKHIMQALNAGKKVICTKPLLSSLTEAKELVDCKNKNNGIVFVGQSSRFFEPMVRQRADYEKDRHGDLISVETHYNTDARWFLKKAWSLKTGFSWMYNFMIHAVDLACWYLPDIVEVYGTGVVSSNTKEYGMDCYDTIKFIFKDSTGRFAVVGGHYASAALDKKVEPSINCTIIGTEGISKAEYPNLVYHTNFEGEGPITHKYEDKHDYYFRFGGDDHHAGEYQNYIEYFAECMDRGETPKPDLFEGIRTLSIMKAMEKSLAIGQPIKTREVFDEFDFL